MHEVIADGLEEYLAGSRGSRAFQTHLAECVECRKLVAEMGEVSSLFAALRPEEAVAPAPGFYARLSARLEAGRKPSIWNLFSLDPTFGRRVVFASLLALAVVGSVLVSQEQAAFGPPAPEQLMAIEHMTPNDQPAQDRDLMLVTLTTYED